MEDGDLHARNRFSATTDQACIRTRASGRTATRCLPGNEYTGVSQMCLHYIGGILKHAPALAAFTNPSTNSRQAVDAGL